MRSTASDTPSVHATPPDWGRMVLWVTCALALLRLLYAGRVELAPQEAYYWQYARHLDLSYFDHPPLCAWLMGLSVRLFGEGELAIRLPAILSSAALTGVLYSLGARLYSPAVGALTALAANATVLFGLGAVVMTPDVPLVLCWAAALRVLCELVLPDGKGPGWGGWRWYLLGLLCGLALLSKYTAALLPLQVLVTALLLPRGRAALRTPHPYLACVLALAVFSPVIVWNAQHDWASFAFQTRGRLETVDGLRPYLVGRYVGLQAVAVGPLLYLALLATAGVLVRQALWGDARAKLLAVSSLPGLALFSVVSPLHWVKMNWVAPIYIGLLVAAAAGACALWHARWARNYALATVATGAVLMTGMYLMPLCPFIPFRERDNLVSGWRELAAQVQHYREAAGTPAPLVVGWGYKTASELAFYLPDRPETQSDPVLGGAGLAYDYWLDRVHPGTDAIIVSDARQPLPEAAQRLRASCDGTRELPPVEVHRGTHVVTTFKLWHCRRWHLPEGDGTHPGGLVVRALGTSL
ncbi:glycosyltransferase family 39 protein [Pyxidicoccus parkwayensis]|uniref:Glycosyltransferase family 39 protein n=1 Tax=Pyxidicoccus parkwayensis TaxID=2813578 RepID=A0ABX7P0C2_9BACT|nr:glycosyltransferase family 39 protein [Pyxidicoccus parkwaysis]QSQ24178.1 glycosyltransferase family 39 protein [Pyxidicoccus parkwaysis]